MLNKNIIPRYSIFLKKRKTIVSIIVDFWPNNINASRVRNPLGRHRKDGEDIALLSKIQGELSRRGLALDTFLLLLLFRERGLRRIERKGKKEEGRSKRPDRCRKSPRDLPPPSTCP